MFGYNSSHVFSLRYTLTGASHFVGKVPGEVREMRMHAFGRARYELWALGCSLMHCRPVTTRPSLSSGCFNVVDESGRAFGIGESLTRDTEKDSASRC